MNARPLPRCSTPQFDIAALEWEIPTGAAVNAAQAFLKQLSIDSKDTSLLEQTPHVHMSQLLGSKRIGRDIRWCGCGSTASDAQRCALFAATARLVHADLRSMAISSCTVEQLLPAHAAGGAFPDLLPLLSDQKDRTLATVQFRQLSGTQVMPVPLALVNPNYVVDVEQGQPQPGVADTFDYSVLRKYSSDVGIAAGATLDEALLQGLLAAQEHHACGEFAVKGMALRQPHYLCRVPRATLPDPILELMDEVGRQLRQPIHLLDISGSGQIPTLLAFADGGSEGHHWIAAGAGFTPEHAATRALRTLRQNHQRSLHDAAGVRGESCAPRQQQEAFVRAEEGHYRRFSLQALHESLEAGHYQDVSYDRRRVPVRLTLGERIRGFCDALQAEGKVPWYTVHAAEGRQSGLHCVQVILAPFDANFLLMQGVPVGLSQASITRPIQP